MTWEMGQIYVSGITVFPVVGVVAMFGGDRALYQLLISKDIIFLVAIAHELARQASNINIWLLCFAFFVCVCVCIGITTRL